MGGCRGAARPDPRCPRCPLTRTRSGLFPLTFASVVGRRLAAACVLFRRSSRKNVKGVVGSGRGAGCRVSGSRQSYRDRPGSDGALEHQPFARDWTGNSIVARPLPLSWEDWPGGSSSTLRCPADRGGQRDLSGGGRGGVPCSQTPSCVWPARRVFHPIFSSSSPAMGLLREMRGGRHGFRRRPV